TCLPSWRVTSSLHSDAVCVRHLCSAAVLEPLPPRLGLVDGRLRPLSLRSSIAKTRDVKLTLKQKCNTQSFPVVCDSPSPGTSWRNRENPAPLRAHVSATIGTETVATLVKVSTCLLHVRNIALGKMISSGKYIARVRS